MKIAADFSNATGAMPHGCPSWVVMWGLVTVVYAGFKWVMWRNAIRGGVRATRLRSFIFLVLWPGMDARRFLDPALRAERPALGAWVSGAANVALGATLVWGIARAAGDGLLAGTYWAVLGWNFYK